MPGMQKESTAMKSHESALQIACFKWFRMQYRRYEKMFFAIPNGGSRTTKQVKNKAGNYVTISLEGKRMKEEGVTPGVADTFLSVPCNGFHGLYIELKWGKNTLSDEQKEFLGQARDQGYATAVVYSFDEFKKTIENYFGYAKS